MLMKNDEFRHSKTLTIFSKWVQLLEFRKLQVVTHAKLTIGATDQWERVGKLPWNTKEKQESS